MVIGALNVLGGQRRGQRPSCSARKLIFREASRLTTHSHSAAAHQRTRQDHAQETAEDYVETVAELIEKKAECRIVDLSDRFGVSHVTALRVVKRLQSEGLVKTEPYRPVELTAKGRRLAKVCQERHELVYQFLLKLGVGPKAATVDAEGIEHHLSPDTLDRMRDFLQS